MNIINMMDDNLLFSACVNPLQFIKADDLHRRLKVDEPTPEDILNFLCSPDISSDSQDIINRYKEINIENPPLFIVPSENVILKKLIWPLRHAKSSYLIGNYIGAIALCGMVSEMITMLIFDTTKLHINEKEMTEADQISLFGSSFEKLSQDRRVKILSAYNLITKDNVCLFDLVRKIRRKYLHLWSQPHDELPKDVISCFTSTVQIVVLGLGLQIIAGQIHMKPSIIEYMRKHNILSNS